MRRGDTAFVSKPVAERKQEHVFDWTAQLERADASGVVPNAHRIASLTMLLRSRTIGQAEFETRKDRILDRALKV